MQSPDGSATADDRQVQQLLKEYPSVLNSELNEAMGAIGTDFSRRFTRASLQGTGVRIRRKGRTIGGSPSLPVKMRAAGFKGVVAGRTIIEGKRLWVGTRNPVMVMHETGGTISAKKGLGMALPFSGSKQLGAGNWVAEKKAGPDVFPLRLGNKVILATLRMRGERMIGIRGLAHYRRSVRMKARLGFISCFAAYEEAALDRLEKAFREAGRKLSRFYGSPAWRAGPDESGAVYYSFEGGGSFLGGGIPYAD